MIAFDLISTQRGDLKIRRVEEYFWRTSRFWKFGQTILSVWYIFSMETNAKEKTEK